MAARRLLDVSVQINTTLLHIRRSSTDFVAQAQRALAGSPSSKPTDPADLIGTTSKFAPFAEPLIYPAVDVAQNHL